MRFEITNCGLGTRSVAVGALYDDEVNVEPKSVELRPFERGEVTVTYGVPSDTGTDFEKRVLVGVSGCRAHLVDWTISVRKRGANSCHEIEIEDCPDLVHHWYDHFYCQRPCLHRIERE